MCSDTLLLRELNFTIVFWPKAWKHGCHRSAHLFVRTQTNGSRTYLLIADNVRVDGKIKQRVLHRMGRLDQLLASGQLDSLIQSLGRFSEKLAILGAHA